MGFPLAGDSGYKRYRRDKERSNRTEEQAAAVFRAQSAQLISWDYNL